MPRDNLGRSPNFKTAEKGAKLALFFGLCWNHPGYPKLIAHTYGVTMLVQDYLRDFKAAYGDWLPDLKFLIMFIGTVFGPLVLLVVGGRDPKTLSETGRRGLSWRSRCCSSLAWGPASRCLGAGRDSPPSA